MMGRKWVFTVIVALGVMNCSGEASPRAGEPDSGSGSGGADPSGGTGGSSDATGGRNSTDTGGSGGGSSSSTGGSGGEAGTPGQGPRIELAGDIHQHCRTQRCGNDLGDGKSCQLSNDQLKTVAVTFGGDTATTYDVTLRIRGLVEPRRFRGGMLQDPEKSQWFYVGGEPDPNTANSGHLYGYYEISVADPEQRYFLNADSQGYSDNQTSNHELYELNDLGTIRVRGGAMVSIINADAQGSGMIRNHRDMTVADVPTDCVMQPWDGQFIYLEVESISVVN